MKKKHIILVAAIAILALAASLTVLYVLLPQSSANHVPDNSNSQFQPIADFEDIQNDIEAITSEPLSYQSFISSANGDISGDQIIDIDMKRLAGLYKHLNRYYLWDIDYDAVYDAMATAMFDTLGDQYSYYVKADDAEDYEEEMTGQYGGLGFYFSKHFTSYQNTEKEDTLYCNISQVFPNTPAARAGVQSGDMIIRINGEDVTPLEANDCAKLIKGEVGTEVTVTVKRNGTTFDLTMKRETITVPTVEYTMLDNKIGYMLILKFSRDTVNMVGKSLIDLKRQGMKGLIIDLRDNPGGDVDATLNIANFFISDKRTLLTVSYKDPSQNYTYKATSTALVDDGTKIAVLINGGTASSAEILSAALRDNERATLIGTKSFGKGIMQVVTQYGEGCASVTTASLVPPSGNEYHKIGLTPDIEVPSIIVQEDERDTYNKLTEDKVAEEFVNANPDYTVKNVNRFVKQNSDSGLREEILQILVRNEYYLKMNYDDRPKADTWFDPQIKKAVELLSEK